jgi:acylphosphatase
MSGATSEESLGIPFGQDADLILSAACDNFRTAMERVRAHVIIEGRVQGVFFRHHTHEKAQELGVTGWVKNSRDGRVEAVFEGEKASVERIVQWCHRGPFEARVTEVTVTWEDPQGEFDLFAIVY